ncbi:hypothetical protein VTK73DRAFT_3695 [Phialemonium thermophilum]|uniref:Uncharacterized protein n=1 Tax=Phialemonium thermophilum TaxID=223376 RepID=A0ABR3WYM2_9PEZI
MQYWAPFGGVRLGRAGPASVYAKVLPEACGYVVCRPLLRPCVASQLATCSTFSGCGAGKQVLRQRTRTSAECSGAQRTLAGCELRRVT